MEIGFLTQFFQRALERRHVRTQENGRVARIHIEGNVLYLLVRLVRAAYRRHVHIAFLFELFPGHEIGDPLEVGLADHHIGTELQFFNGDIEDGTVFQYVNEAALGIHAHEGRAAWLF
jgi:hypothetical protein